MPGVSSRYLPSVVHARRGINLVVVITIIPRTDLEQLPALLTGDQVRRVDSAGERGDHPRFICAVDEDRIAQIGDADIGQLPFKANPYGRRQLTLVSCPSRPIPMGAGMPGKVSMPTLRELAAP